MQRRLTHRIAVTVAATGVVATGLAWALGGLSLAQGAVAGALVALANWTALGWVIARVTARGANRSPRGVVVLLVLKMGALFVLCWWLVTQLGLDAVGLAIGLTALPLGLFLGAGLATEGAAPPRPRPPELGEKLEG